VRSPLILAAFKTARDEIVVDPPEIVPDTTRLFWTVAADTDTSPLIVTALNTFRDETVVVAAAAEIFPTTVKLF
jgi:hypothetical protein